ncbi:transmembrane protein 214-B isoform X2 [Thrips palmi]|uniref:Transmembrane protein 214-B isoform X2 n=1 Tax=Thrips palmi TaxID=161013 RepID=A0A6P8ZMX7_THRPL|nr:transmembrane protein 214-B isoform X2 [Thrips palmi]
MSGPQWELVTKNKKDKPANGVTRKLTKTEKKKFADNAPKVEDLLPMSKVKSLYSDFPEVNKPPAVDVKKGKENDAKKQQQKKPQQQKAEKPKESKPKTLDAAINRIDVPEFQNLIAALQAKFDGSTLMWLRTIDNFLDQSLTVEISDPVFSSKNHEYPLCLLPPAMLSSLKDALETAGEANRQLYFEILLNHLAQELTKGFSAVGTRILLQVMGTSYPETVVAAIPKCLALQNSYKSRKPIWLSILWAMGQGGFKDLSVGLKVWQDVMLPVLELRNYSQYVVEYLTRLLGRHSASPALSVDEYLSAMDSILRPDVSISNLLTDSLQRQAKILRKIAVNATPDAKLNLFFKPLMNRLATADTDAYKEEVLEFLYLCLCADDQCFNTWKQIYSSNLSESAALLEHIASKASSSETKPAEKSCKSFIDFVVKTNASLQTAKPKLKGLEDSRKVCESLSFKMASKKKSSYWKFISFILILAFGGMVAYDIKLHGSFKESTVGRTLHDTGALAYGNLALEQAKVYTQKGAEWTRENGPIYYASAVEVSKPYLELARDLGLIAYNSASKACVAVDSWCTTNAPEVTSQVKKYATVAGETFVQYAGDFGRYTRVGFQSAQEYAAKNIFVSHCCSKY